MRDLILGDIHNRIDRVDRILGQERYDRYWTLGDWFDPGGVKEARRTAGYLKKRLQDKNGTHIFGNHDLSYGFVHLNSWFASPGFTVDKFKAIDQALGSREAFYQLKLHAWIDDQGPRPWLLSHGGAHPATLQHLEPANYRQAIDYSCAQALELLHAGKTHFVLGAWTEDGGTQQIGGMVWLRWMQFRPLIGINQIVGHSPGTEARHMITESSENWCIDTHLIYYAILEDGKIEIKRL